MAINSRSEISLLLDACLGASRLQKEYSLDSNRLLKLLYFHGIRPVFLSHIHKFNIGIDPDAERILISDCQQMAVRNMLSTNEFVSISKALANSGITCYAYKGGFWADWLYGNLGHREFGDIDILIPKDKFAEAVNLLASDAGYVADDYRQYLLNHQATRASFFATDYHIPMTKDTDGSQMVVEAHWQIAYPRLLFHFPSTEWPQYALDYTLLGRQVKSFVNEYQFLVLLVHHGGKEQWSKLKYIADLAAYLNRYGHTTDWELVSKLAREKGIYHLLQYSLGLIKGLGIVWKDSWPTDVQITDPAPLFELWESMPKQATNSTWPYFTHGLAMHDGFKFKGKLILEHLKYASELRLLWHKFLWYRRSR